MRHFTKGGARWAQRAQRAVALAALWCAGCTTPTASEHALPPEARQALVEAEHSFTLAGQPIHPLLIHLFNGSEADDGPYVIEVDVHEAQGNNEFTAPVQRADGEVFAYVPDTQPPERCGYECLGALADGTQVVRTDWNGGGSGTFSQVILLHFHLETYRRFEGTWDWRLVLKYEGGMLLPMHYDGKITIKGHEVDIGAATDQPEEKVLVPAE